MRRNPTVTTISETAIEPALELALGTYLGRIVRVDPVRRDDGDYLIWHAELLPDSRNHQVMAPVTGVTRLVWDPDSRYYQWACIILQKGDLDAPPALDDLYQFQQQPDAMLISIGRDERELPTIVDMRYERYVDWELRVDPTGEHEAHALLTKVPLERIGEAIAALRTLASD